MLQSCFPAGWPLQRALVCWVIPPQEQDFVLPFDKHVIPVGRALQPVEGGTTLWGTNHSSWLGIICKLADSVFRPILQVINEDVTQ